MENRSPDSDLHELGERVSKVESNLVLQEHRVFYVIWNALTMGKPGSAHPQKRNARMALIWLIARPGSIVLASGGVVAVFSLIYLARQTRAVVEQNVKFDDQLAFEKEREQAERDADYRLRKAQVLSVLFDVKRRWIWTKPDPVASARARQEAVFSFVSLQRQRTGLTGEYCPLDLSEVDLSNMDFCGTDPSSRYGRAVTPAHLRNHELAGVFFHRANLRGVRMNCLDLSGSVFSSSRLDGANLETAILTGADFTAAEMTGANLEGAELAGAILAATNLTDANLRDANLEGAEFAIANLKGANLNGANMRDAKLLDARLSGTILIDADLSGAMLSGARLHTARVGNTKYSRKTVFPIDFISGFRPEGWVLVE